MLLHNASQKTGRLKVDEGFFWPQDPVSLSLPCYLHLWSPSSGQLPVPRWALELQACRAGRGVEVGEAKGGLPVEPVSRGDVRVGAMWSRGGARRVVFF